MKSACRARTRRGASMVEYALVLMAVLVFAAVAIKLLGPPLKTTAVLVGRQLS